MKGSAVKLVVLGCGSVGTEVARSLASAEGVDHITVADIDGARAGELACELGGEGREFDAGDPRSVADVISDAGLVFNAVGPHYRFCLPLVQAAIEARVNYVDINDDYDVAAELVRNPWYDRGARAAGISVLTGAGTTPGMTNVLARWGFDQLDQARTVSIGWAVPFIVNLSPAVVEHMFHILSGDVIQFIEGEYVSVPAGSGERVIEQSPPYGTYKVAFSGHGEAATNPKFLPGLREVTVRSTFFQEAGNELYRSLIRQGFGSSEVIPGLQLSPRGFMAQFLCTEQAETALSIDVSNAPFGAVFYVEVAGDRDGRETKVIYEMHLEMSGDELADPTVHAAAIAVKEFLAGRVTTHGVIAPEACLEPARVIPLFCELSGISLHQKVVSVNSGPSLS
jgi:saccharopine dehydrogenase (NAD+, L-lysine-forming)